MSKVIWEEIDNLELYSIKITCEIKNETKTQGILQSISLYSNGKDIEANAVFEPFGQPANYQVLDFKMLKIVNIEEVD